jgi:hypothetical protein
MNRATKSLKINPEVWKEIKLHCVKEDLEISAFIEQTLKERLKKKNI